jgi:hypothetical protein
VKHGKKVLTDALDELFERFCIWADDGVSATDLSEEIHKFHNGISRELYKIYAMLQPHMAVARAIAKGFFSDESLDPSLCEKLQPLIEGHRVEDVRRGIIVL